MRIKVNVNLPEYDDLRLMYVHAYRDQDDKDEIYHVSQELFNWIREIGSQLIPY